MSGSDTETLTAALRRLADEHASGLLSVATPGRDVVLELADGAPVGIGPTHDVSDRVGRDAGPSLVAAAVVDGLVDRTVAAIVGGEGAWTWDVSSDADMMPVPPGLATEISRRAVDAAQALATLDPDLVLQPGRDLATSGEVGRIRALFDGERSIAEVAEEADITVPACATSAAALVRAGVLTTGIDDTSPRSWTDTVAGADDEDDDEPELWVMDEPDDLDEFDDEPEDADEPAAEADESPAEVDEPAAEVADPLQGRRHRATPTATDTPTLQDAATTDPAAVTDTADADRDGREAQDPARERPEGDTARATPEGAPSDDITQAVEWVAGDDEPSEPASSAPAASTDTSAPADTDDGWDDTGWLDDLEESSSVRPRDDDAAVEPGGADERADRRGALSSMISELQGSGSEVQPRDQAPPARTADEQDRDARKKKATDATRKEPKAEPGEVAEFLRELSRLALDED